MPLEYILITPARNEAALIASTIKAVLAQTRLPKKWIIVSDASTDATDSIVASYAATTPWIELLRLGENEERNFAAKARVFRAGYLQIGRVAHDVVGNLDADITFDADYFECLLSKFEADPKLGVAGTHYVEGDFHSFDDSYINAEHVNGGCQLFRRACFEEVGGYPAIKGGGIDWVAVTTARMKGWRTQSFGDKVFHHHRAIGTAEANQLISRFRYGKKDYFLGGHPAWQICRGLFQMTKRPYVVGGLATLVGYMWSFLLREHRPVSNELLRFHRQEQMARLRQLLATRFQSR